MPPTSKQKGNARKSRDADMISDIENVHIWLGSNHLESERSGLSNSVRRRERSSYNALVNHDVNSHSNSREVENMGYAGNGQN